MFTQVVLLRFEYVSKSAFNILLVVKKMFLTVLSRDVV